MSREDAAGVTRRLLALHAIHPASRGQFEDALTLASTHQLQFWDALILATAADAGCRILLSEDMSDGFVWRGCTVVNPFAEPTHPLLADALRA
jgi:predicted nucleic acid-binding protein